MDDFGAGLLMGLVGTFLLMCLITGMSNCHTGPQKGECAYRCVQATPETIDELDSYVKSSTCYCLVPIEDLEK